MNSCIIWTKSLEYITFFDLSRKVTLFLKKNRHKSVIFITLAKNNSNLSYFLFPYNGSTRNRLRYTSWSSGNRKQRQQIYCSATVLLTRNSITFYDCCAPCIIEEDGARVSWIWALPVHIIHHHTHTHTLLIENIFFYQKH